jgi:hypothetical protein
MVIDCKPNISNDYLPEINEARSRNVWKLPIGKISKVTFGVLPPNKMLLGTLSDGRFKVKSPISVNFKTQDAHIVAEAIGFNEFGYGKNRSEALRDLQVTLVELYTTLDREQARLGSDLYKIWQKLQSIVTKR